MSLPKLFLALLSSDESVEYFNADEQKRISKQQLVVTRRQFLGITAATALVGSEILKASEGDGLGLTKGWGGNLSIDLGKFRALVVRHPKR